MPNTVNQPAGPGGQQQPENTYTSSQSFNLKSESLDQT